MKISFRKLVPMVLALGLAFAGAAKADIVSPFNLKDGAGNTYVAGATSLDWNQQGSGVAINTGAFNDSAVLPVGFGFDFLYQANLVSTGGAPMSTLFTSGLDANSNGSPDVSPLSGFEFTIVAKIKEKVIASGDVGGPFAKFGLGGTSADNKVAIYYDKAMNANTLAGTGFDDGTLIALLTVVSNGTTSSFNSNPGENTGGGFARLHATKVEAVDFINNDYLEGITDLLFGMKFQSNLNYPAGSSYANAFQASTEPMSAGLFPTHVVTANDIVFKVDGSNEFTVPEPGSILLLGVGLLGLVGASRRRNAKKAA